VELDFPEDVIQFAAGNNHTTFLKKDGTILSIGDNSV
jgi:alpha-tubulin suppressor-like RCC1 family protein